MSKTKTATKTAPKSSKKPAAKPSVVETPVAPVAPPVETPAVPPVDPLEAQHAAAVESLAEKAMEITYEVNGLPGSRVADDGDRNKMVATVGANKRAYSISKRLFCSRHPLIKELNGTRTRLDKWRDGFVIVKAVDSATDEIGRKRIVAGVRLIMSKDIAEFEQGFKVRVDEMYIAADLLQKHMTEPYDDGKKVWPSVLDAEKAELGESFNPKDYPANIRDCVQVKMPTYTDYKVSMKLPAEVRKRQEQRIAEALNGTLETATEYVSNTLTDIFTTFANQLVNRTRLFPDVEGEFGKYHGAELVRLKTHDDDDKIPLGKVIPVVRYKTAGADIPKMQTEGEDYISGGKEQTITEEVGLFGEGDDYEARLKPETTDERKALNKSVLDNLFTQLDTVSKVKEMLGPYGDKIDDTLVKVRTMLKQAGKSSESILTEAKNSSTYRTTLATALNRAVSELSETVETVKKVRRKINPNLIGLKIEE